jgi:hypothetical protein
MSENLAFAYWLVVMAALAAGLANLIDRRGDATDRYAPGWEESYFSRP